MPPLRPQPPSPLPPPRNSPPHGPPPSPPDRSRVDTALCLQQNHPPSALRAALGWGFGLSPLEAVWHTHRSHSISAGKKGRWEGARRCDASLFFSPLSLPPFFFGVIALAVYVKENCPPSLPFVGCGRELGPPSVPHSFRPATKMSVLPTTTTSRERPPPRSCECCTHCTSATGSREGKKAGGGGKGYLTLIPLPPQSPSFWTRGRGRAKEKEEVVHASLPTQERI